VDNIAETEEEAIEQLKIFLSFMPLNGMESHKIEEQERTQTIK